MHVMIQRMNKFSLSFLLNVHYLERITHTMVFVINPMNFVAYEN